ncbi:enoyl-CoA hydratase/isomerase family protein [Georgenia wangjunii]|uniref:enoyl-CoA hydratase/isomerase family protein n=1 Tax=Georgenia wangjunii TaxID=3117730 RepID=UPI002F26C216
MTALLELTLGTRCEITLANPPLNVVSHELTVQLRAALKEVAAHPEARVLVLTGAGGRAFCAGSDIAEFEALHRRAAEDKLLLEKLVYRQLARLAIPTIAAIEGHALGGGLELALSCDLRVASEQSKLGMPELKLGVLPGSGGTQRLARVVGLARAKELILLGEVVTAERAEQIGLVNRVAPRGSALDVARELADTIASRGPRAARLAKWLIDSSLDRTLDEGLALELDASEDVFDSEDMLEGARAFREKRTPRFTGH